MQNTATIPHPAARIAVAWQLDPFIDNAYVRGEGPAIAVENPAEETTIATVRSASLAQVDQAVASARRAFTAGHWRDVAVRRATMLRMADLLEARQAEFVSALVQEVGTPISLCAGIHIGGPLAMLRLFAEACGKDRTRQLGSDGHVPESISEIRFSPIGVVAAIGAYNYPLTMMIAKAGAALAAGCTCVFLSNPQTPLASLLFGEIARDAGVPPGVLNVLVGGPEVGSALVSHPGVDKISFTGSVDVGRKVMEQAAVGLKGVVLELGGKSPGIILPGTDVASVALPLHGRYLRNAGQGCQSPTRLFVPRAQLDDFIAASKVAFDAIQVGDPWDPATLAGPLISKAHRARVAGFVDRAVAAGGRIVLGGGIPANQPRGWYYSATMVTGLNNRSEIARNELFGPVSLLLPYDDIDEMVGMANDSDFGLAAHIYGDLAEAKALADRLECGTVFINGAANPRFEAILSGWKQSGIGHEWGEDGVLEFLAPKHVQWLR